MSTNYEESRNASFEIDCPEKFGQFILGSPQENLFYLRLLAKQRSIVTAYLNEGDTFFLSSFLAIDDDGDKIFLDPPANDGLDAQIQGAQKVTLVANLDRVKIQIRLSGLERTNYQSKSVLGVRFPVSVLRLQRREFFRLEPPVNTPIRCKLMAKRPDGTKTTLELPLSDISGGGLSLICATELGDLFPRDTLFQNCRLEIPGEGVIQVNLRVRKLIEISGRNGEHSLRIGCEFTNLPGTQLAFIERYITRVERERKARDTGL